MKHLSVPAVQLSPSNSLCVPRAHSTTTDPTSTLAHPPVELNEIEGMGRVYGVGLYGIRVYGVGVYGIRIYGVGVYGIRVYGVGVYGIRVYGVGVCGV